MAAHSTSAWPEIDKAEKEKRRELVLQGASIDKKIEDSGGVHPKLYSLALLNYLEISQCVRLQELHDEIRNLTQLQSLILCRNSISSVPKSIGELKSLKVLDLSVNNLQELPDEISFMNELTTLNVSCNKISALPGSLNRCTKLSSINVSKNVLCVLPDELFFPSLELLNKIVASENCIDHLNPEVHNLPALKVLDMSNNKLSEIPFELADCPKLKEINFKGNSLKDKRLEKMVNGCQTKSVLDYLRVGGRGKGKGKQQDTEGAEKSKGNQNVSQKKNKRKNKQEEEEDKMQKMVVRILHISDNPSATTVTVSSQVKDVRPFIVCCIVKGMNLKPGNALKRFLAVQTKLHDEVCAKRTVATIATHDLSMLKGPLQYDARSPDVFRIVPLGRKEMTAADLLKILQQEADEQRKQKKRQNVPGLHKYLQLLDGKENFPCLLDADGHVISFPPITNSERTKIKKTTQELFLEVTSSTSLQICKDVMDILIIKMAELNKLTIDNKEEVCSEEETESTLGTAQDDFSMAELTVVKVRVVDTEGNLKVIYPSKTDLNSDVSHLNIIR